MKYLCTKNTAVSLVETLTQLLAHELNYWTLLTFAAQTPPSPPSSHHQTPRVSRCNIQTKMGVKGHKRRCVATLKVGASTLALLTLGELAASSTCSRPNLRDADTTWVGRTSRLRCVLHRRAPTLTLLDHTPFHEDDTEDHKQEANLWIGRAPVRERIQMGEGSALSKQSWLEHA